MNGTIGNAIAFFYEHAGYSYDPKTQTPDEGRGHCAMLLANAEVWARNNGVFYVWERDYNNDEQGWSCVAYQYQADPGSDPLRIGGLYEIDLGSESPLDYRPGHRSTYARVVEAELAFEAMPS